MATQTIYQLKPCVQQKPALHKTPCITSNVLHHVREQDDWPGVKVRGELQHRPVVAIFPAPSSAEQTVKINDRRVPIPLYERTLDGRGRYSACKQLRFEPDTCEYERGYCRHLTDYERAMAVARKTNEPRRRAAPPWP